MLLFLQAGSFGSGDCGDAMHRNLRRVRRDFATLFQEIFGEQAEKDICFEGRCGDAFSAIIQGKSCVENFASIPLLRVLGSPERDLRFLDSGRTRRRRGGEGR
jgi:hypothetical protein